MSRRIVGFLCKPRPRGNSRLWLSGEAKLRVVWGTLKTCRAALNWAGEASAPTWFVAQSASYQTRQAFSLTMGWPALQLNAF
jgi:hypothetical protein